MEFIQLHVIVVIQMKKILKKSSKISALTKTYSFKRIISFRSDNFRRGNSRSVMGNSHSPKNIGRCSPSPFYLKDPYRGGGVGPQQPYKPLTFSFLGQIYAKKSIKGDKTELSYSKRKLDRKINIENTYQISR